MEIRDEIVYQQVFIFGTEPMQEILKSIG